MKASTRLRLLGFVGMAGEEDRMRALEEQLGYTFRQRELLEAAVTHRSWANEQGRTDHYERLEFLGDAVLGLVAAEWLYRRLPDQPEGELARLKSHLVSAPVLAHHAEELGLGELLRLGVGEERSGGRTKPSLLADSLEGVLGAVYIDGGLEGARHAIEALLERAMANQVEVAEADAKTRLQEWAQARGGELPNYVLVGEEGPDHAKLFTMECRFGGRALGSGTGRTKKHAEQRAAAAALATLAES